MRSARSENLPLGTSPSRLEVASPDSLCLFDGEPGKGGLFQTFCREIRTNASVSESTILTLDTFARAASAQVRERDIDLISLCAMLLQTACTPGKIEALEARRLASMHDLRVAVEQMAKEVCPDRGLAHQTCFEGLRFVPHGQRNAADLLQNRPALRLETGTSQDWESKTPFQARIQSVTTGTEGTSALAVGRRRSKTNFELRNENCFRLGWPDGQTRGWNYQEGPRGADSSPIVAGLWCMKHTEWASRNRDERRCEERTCRFADDGLVVWRVDAGAEARTEQRVGR